MPKISIEATLLNVAADIIAQPGDMLILLGDVVVGVQPHNAGFLREPDATKEQWDARVLSTLRANGKMPGVDIANKLGLKSPEQRACVSGSLRRLVEWKKIKGSPKGPDGGKNYFWELVE